MRVPDILSIPRRERARAQKEGTVEVIMSIRKIHAVRIFGGSKDHEFRTRVWNPRKVKVSRVFVYVPEMKSVVGSFIPGEIFRVTSTFLKRIPVGPRKTVVRYLNGRPGFGIEIGTRFPVISPRSLKSFGITRAPQSWQYLKGCD